MGDDTLKKLEQAIGMVVHGDVIKHGNCVLNLAAAIDARIKALVVEYVSVHPPDTAVIHACEGGVIVCGATTSSGVIHYETDWLHVTCPRCLHVRVGIASPRQSSEQVAETFAKNTRDVLKPGEDLAEVASTLERLEREVSRGGR